METEAAPTGLARVCIKWGPRTERSEHMLPPLIKKLAPIDNLANKKLLFFKGISLGKQTTLKGRLHAQYGLVSTQNEVKHPWRFFVS